MGKEIIKIGFHHRLAVDRWLNEVEGRRFRRVEGEGGE